MAAEDAAAPVPQIAVGGKLRNGLFLKGVFFCADRISFDVFASRAFQAEELATLHLDDNVGTHYEMVPLEADGIEGHARIEFTPAVPASWSRLDLSQPDRGLILLKDLDPTPLARW